MATLNSSNIVNGNIVETTDILQLYDALTAGGGTTGVYDVSISGSLTGSATSATSASYALSASFATSASFAISSSRAVSSSFATTASFALTTPTPTFLNVPVSNSGSAYANNTLGIVAGSLTAAGGIATTPASDPLKSKVIGTSLFINATIFAPGGPANSVGVRSYNAGTGQIDFQTGGGTGTEFIMFTAYYIPS
jgi:hypothetical protein